MLNFNIALEIIKIKPELVLRVRYEDPNDLIMWLKNMPLGTFNIVLNDDPDTKTIRFIDGNITLFCKGYELMKKYSPPFIKHECHLTSSYVPSLK